jgi:hypothetical protein
MPQMRLQHLEAVVAVTRAIGYCGKCLVGHCLDRFIDRQHASGLPRLLLPRAM